MRRSDLRWLRQAIALSEQARAAGDEPFGSVLVGAGGVLLAEARNTVVTDRDVSAHPELKLAVWAGRHLDPEVARLTTMYTSCENCAMCSAAMVWVGIGTLVFALSGASLMELQGAGHASLALSSREVFARASRPVAVRGPLIEDEARVAHAGYWA
ncbi:tRNA(Arg) A34 adenosine deaminase TadA [Conexibacter arvalis]|uniref:tRNA(Arg) A34 adenosine deaminase TadA n=1 Tax=Conexibacter arvalis TaxID=912552 RepID=A0A840IBM9_9ACTN|nr:tRNA(Arg) A34 adenosine deaminase TadA [Conexibacter arvalis]